jgi:HSP20 family protein
VEIVEYADGHQITLEVPGIPKEQITIEVEGHTLTVSGTRTATLPEDTKVHRQERTFGQFRKSFTAGQTLDLANLTATTSNGLLTLRIPKLPSAQPRKIEVRETL